MYFSCVYAKKAVLLHPILSRDGGIGRHEGLKILWPVMAVRVQVPLAVLKEKSPKAHKLAYMCVWDFLFCKWRQGTYEESPAVLKGKSQTHICLLQCVFAIFILTQKNLYTLCKVRNKQPSTH